MSKSTCLTCIWESETGITVDGTKTKKDWAKKVGVNEASIRRYFKHSATNSAGKNRKLEDGITDLPGYSRSVSTDGKKEINWRGARR